MQQPGLLIYHLLWNLRSGKEPRSITLHLLTETQSGLFGVVVSYSGVQYRHAPFLDPAVLAWYGLIAWPNLHMHLKKLICKGGC